MRSLQQQVLQLHQKIKTVNGIHLGGIFKPTGYAWREKFTAATTREIVLARRQLTGLHYSIKHIGASDTMDDYEQRKLGIFNLLNFFQLITGILIPIIGLFHNNKFPSWGWAVAMLPATTSIIVLHLNARHRYDAALIIYFLCYPVMTSIVYMSGINVGAELFFILFGVLSVFFLQQISHMLFSVSLSMISFFMLAVVWKDHRFQLESSNMFLYLVNQFAGIIFIFYGLFLIKKENVGYQQSVLAKNVEIANNAVLLEAQTVELTELNNLKNKLFSVIAHDLKTPMYSLLGLFRTMQEQSTPAKEIKEMLPDMINNLTYTTGLMDNLLHWAKSQMESGGVYISPVDITEVVYDIIALLQLQAKAKQIDVHCSIDESVCVMADKNMVQLVLRNLLSNAIKFTPEEGTIEIGITTSSHAVEVFVYDSGLGIDPEDMEKINGSEYFTTNGTAHEPGTGLGLMLCKEFLAKNNSRLQIQSTPGQGSRFSFQLPVPAAAETIVASLN